MRQEEGSDKNKDFINGTHEKENNQTLWLLPGTLIKWPSRFFLVLFLDSLQQMDARYLFFPSLFISSRRSRQQFGWWIMNEVSIPLERQVKQVGWEKICLNIIKTTAPPSRRVNTEFFMAEGHRCALKRVMPALHLFVSASWCFKTSDAFMQEYFGLKCKPSPPKPHENQVTMT